MSKATEIDLHDLSEVGQAAQASQKLDPVVITMPPKMPAELLTPDAQAAMNALISAAVASAIGALAPVIKEIGFSPEKMAEYERIRTQPTNKEILAQLRDKRERRLQQEDEIAARATRAASQKNCPHQYPTGSSAIHLTHNYPDRQTRGTCALCMLPIHPREWRIGAPDNENPRGVPYVEPEHPLYYLVKRREANGG